MPTGLKRAGVNKLLYFTSLSYIICQERGVCMKYPLKNEMRAYYAKKFFVSLVWVIFWYAACYVQIEFFYGPGAAFADGHPYLFGVICGVDFVGVAISTVYLIIRIVCLMGFRGKVVKCMKKYLSPEFTEEPFELLEQDIQYKFMNSAEIYIGEEWIVFPRHAIYRDSIVGIFYEVLSESYLSRKVRLTLVDNTGNSIYVDIAPRFHPAAYHYLIEWHPCASCGTFQAFLNFQNQQIKLHPEEGIRYKELQRMPNATVGTSKWDRSAILEDNTIHNDYERWLLAAYSTYLIDTPLCHNNFTYAGGFERTAYHKETVTEILNQAWDIKNELHLIATTTHLEKTGKAKDGGKADGWQLGRSIMLWGFGYIAEMCTRDEMQRFSLDAALAIQQSFTGWKEYLDSHMAGYEAWVKDRSAIARRRKAYKKLLKDPNSIINTVPFRSDLKSLCREALRELGIEDSEK